MKTVEFGCEHPQVILLLHGGGLSWWQYEEAARLLAERFHVVLPVLDGHAGSGVPFISMEENARRVLALVDERFGGHVLLAGGLSLGGQVLAAALAMRPDLCRCAVLESTLALPTPVTAACIRPAFGLCYPLVKQRWFARLQFLSLKIKPALFEDYFRDSAAIAKEDMIAFLAANAAFTAPEALAACQAKALILVGGRERPVMKRSARKLAALLPHASLEVLPGLAHGEYSINRADQFARRLEQLVSG